MPSVQTLVNTSIFDSIFEKGLKLRHMAADAGGATYTIGSDYPPVVLLDPGGGAISALLPAEADGKSKVFIIFNTADAAEAIAVKEDSGTTTIITLDQNQAGVVFCDGTTWHGFIGGIT